MSYDKPGKQHQCLAPLDPALFEPPEMLAALAAHDVATVYRRLVEGGISQHQLARRTGQSQSEICEILKGRKVGMYEVLVRICEGLKLPRELMGLSYGERGAYAEGARVADPPEEVNAEMRRRALLAAAGVAIMGRSVFGEPLDLPGPSPVTLPPRLDWIHVEKVRDLIHRLGEADHGHTGDPDICSAAAARATRLLKVPGPEQIQRALLTAVAELDIEAGWAAFDAGLYHQAMHHCTRALEVATEAGDAYCQATALNQAGLATLEYGYPNDALKMLQIGQVKAWDIPRDERRVAVIGESGRAAVEACGLASSATALAQLGQQDAARIELTKARELWQPTRKDPFGDLNRPTAHLELDRGRLDIAEQFAAASVRRWDGVNTGGRTRSGVMLATIYVQAGEPHGLAMAKHAVDAVAQLGSPRTRRQLGPLVGALAARPGDDARELARAAHQVAAA
jgi:transcriptional regulator with XRE-family HTH domain